ncbi:MAG: nitroreductase family protein [Armatimonadota bacterium]|nr:nitroreductase family protein [bacterium]
MCEFSVNASLCTRCGLCVSDCVSNIIEMGVNGLPSISPEKKGFCLKCQHCLTVCPTGAVSVLGKNPADSQPISGVSMPSFEQMDHFVRGRRSVRHYKDENVDPALIDSLLNALAHAPTGCNAQELTFNVIDDKDVMHRFSDQLVTALLKAAASDESEHPFLQQVAPLPREAIVNIVFRSAPHALIVSAPQDAPCAREDVALSLAYFELLAQSAGLGTLWWGFLRLTSGIVPEVKPILGIPDDHEYYAILFGLPKIEFARTAQKEDAAKVRRVTL